MHHVPLALLLLVGGALVPPGGKASLRCVRRRFHLQSMVQIHHIFPKHLASHPALAHYDIDHSDNLVLMPTMVGQRRLRLRDDRLIHDGGHRAYDRHVAKYLDHVMSLPGRMRAVELNATQRTLRAEMRRHTFVPWVE